ncbi:MAG TPA: ATP-binding protein, partial [Pedobacter sp.]
LGTFDTDLVKGTMEWDERFRSLFGISHNRKVTYAGDFLPGLHPDDRERISEIINKAFVKAESNGNYDVEYRTIGAEDQQLRWIKAKGKVFFNEQDEPVRFIGSVLEITDQKQNEIRKNDFIGMVSHELKTPLTSLKAYVQVLSARSKKDNNDFAIGALNKIELQINKMSALINGFLDVSRLESGRIYLNMKEFKLDDLIREIIEESSLIMSSHQITLVPCDCIAINADRDKIGQVITNLISNAVKYSPRGKLVEVVCQRTDHGIQVSVKDEGMGIRTPDTERLFERFYRVESTHSQNISGFGIGLYISAEIINRHGGKIWVESEKGVGSTFFFSLPV